MAKTSKDKLAEELMQSNVALQTKTAELISSVNKLVDKINIMVSVFEDAAKYIKEGTDVPLMNKLNELLDQNKNIARGLILLERYVREQSLGSSLRAPKPMPKTEF